MIQTPQPDNQSPAGLHTDAIPSVRQSRLLDKSKTLWFYGLLVGSKVLSTLSTFLLYDFLQVNHEILRLNHRSPPTGVIFGSWSTHIQVLSVIQILAGTAFMFCQRRFSPWKKSLTTLSRREWLKIFKHATLLSAFLLLWLAGLRLAGPFQTVIITAHYNFTLAGIFTGFFIAKSGVKLRGGVLFAAGVLVLLLFSKNSSIKEEVVPSVSPTKSLSLESDSDQSTTSTNSVTILILVACLAYKMVFEALSKNLATDFGGSRGLHALSTSASGFILLVLYLIDLMSGADMIPFWSNLSTMIIITGFGFVLDYYVDNICLKRLNSNKVVRVGTTATMGSALLYSILRTSDEIPNMATVLAFGLIYFGTLSLTSQEKARGGGSFVGYSSDGLPLFSFSSNFSSDNIPSWKNILLSASSILQQIMGDAISRKMFYVSILTTINFIFEFIHTVVVDDKNIRMNTFQVMFDTLALFIGIGASVICRWKPSKTFPFGYGRIEILSCFLNSIILLVTALRLMIISCTQIYGPVMSEEQGVLFVTVRLFAKLFAVYIFKANIGGSHALLHNMNVKGVFRHIIADIMECTGRIVSILIFSYTGVVKLDAFVFLIVGIMIVTSVIPLLKEASKTLLLSVPDGLEKNLQQAVLQILTLEGVKGYRNARFWTHAPNLLTGSIHVQATQDINEQHVIRQVNNLFNSMGFTHFTTQLEKDEFVARKSFSDHDQYDTVQEAGLEGCVINEDRPGVKFSNSEQKTDVQKL